MCILIGLKVRPGTGVGPGRESTCFYVETPPRFQAEMHADPHEECLAGRAVGEMARGLGPDRFASQNEPAASHSQNIHKYEGDAKINLATIWPRFLSGSALFRSS